MQNPRGSCDSYNRLLYTGGVPVQRLGEGPSMWFSPPRAERDLLYETASYLLVRKMTHHLVPT
jgi:hypothetical protein